MEEEVPEVIKDKVNPVQTGGALVLPKNLTADKLLQKVAEGKLPSLKGKTKEELEQAIKDGSIISLMGRDANGAVVQSLMQGDGDKVFNGALDQNKTLPEWNCRVEGTPADQQWTVGEVFYLFCEGETADFLSTELSLKEEEKTGYELKILEVTKSTNNELEAKATSYIPAAHKFEKLMIYDQGEAVAKIKPFNLNLKSVVTNPQQEPFGPIMAMKLAYPMWIWIALGGVLILAAFWSLFRMKRKAQMKRVIEELKQHNTALGAFNQFNKDVRNLGRQYIFGDTKGWSEKKKERYVESLDEVFRMYLLREFFVPALDWNSNLVVKTISKQDKKRYGIYGDDLQKFLKELDRAKEDSNKLQVHDCKQLTQMAKRVTQHIWKVRKI